MESAKPIAAAAPLSSSKQRLVFSSWFVTRFFGPSTLILMSRQRNALVAIGLLTFASAGLAFPFYMASRSSRSPVIDSSKPLPPQATFRGPYINTGSRDMGPDQQISPKK